MWRKALFMKVYWYLPQSPRWKQAAAAAPGTCPDQKLIGLRGGFDWQDSERQLVAQKKTNQVCVHSQKKTQVPPPFRSQSLSGGLSFPIPSCPLPRCTRSAVAMHGYLYWSHVWEAIWFMVCGHSCHQGPNRRGVRGSRWIDDSPVRLLVPALNHGNPWHIWKK